MKRTAWSLAFVMLSLAASSSVRAQEDKKPIPTPEKAEPRFEPREKFGDGGRSRLPGGASVPTLPSCAHTAFVGPRGTFQLAGPLGEAAFLWPMSGAHAQRYREQMAFIYRTEQTAVYQLVGRFYRVYFAFDRQADASGKRRVWVKNGDRPWRGFDAVAVRGTGF